MKKQIVIIGGGFGGVYTAKHLLKYNLDANITLISDHNYFLFTPLLHEVATGGLTQNNIVHPLSQLFKKRNFECGSCTAKSVDTFRNRVITKHGSIPYDYLILATGAQVNTFNIPGVEEFAIPLKSMRDAKRIRNKVIERLEEASHASEKKRRELLSFAVIGGGPTGVELVSELAELLYLNAEKRYVNIHKNDITIHLIQRGEALLPQVKPHFQQQVEKRLKQLGIKIWYNSAVDKLTEHGAHIEGRVKPILARTMFWTAGVKPRTLPLDNKLFDKGYPVNESLQIKGHTNIFALGDCALFTDLSTNQRVPMLAQVAVAQAPIVAKNIRNLIHKRPLYTYRPFLKGFLVSVGEWYAVAGIEGMLFSGKFAWWLWRTIYLSKLIGFTNKVKVATEWTLNLFFPRDISQLD